MVDSKDIFQTFHSVSSDGVIRDPATVRNRVVIRKSGRVARILDQQRQQRRYAAGYRPLGDRRQEPGSSSGRRFTGRPTGRLAVRQRVAVVKKSFSFPNRSLPTRQLSTIPEEPSATTTPRVGSPSEGPSHAQSPQEGPSYLPMPTEVHSMEGVQPLPGLSSVVQSEERARRRQYSVPEKPAPGSSDPQDIDQSDLEEPLLRTTI